MVNGASGANAQRRAGEERRREDANAANQSRLLAERNVMCSDQRWTRKNAILKVVDVSKIFCAVSLKCHEKALGTFN